MFRLLAWFDVEWAKDWISGRTESWRSFRSFTVCALLTWSGSVVCSGEFLINWLNRHFAELKPIILVIQTKVLSDHSSIQVQTEDISGSTTFSPVLLPHSSNNWSTSIVKNGKPPSVLNAGNHVIQWERRTSKTMTSSGLLLQRQATDATVSSKLLRCCRFTHSWSIEALFG